MASGRFAGAALSRSALQQLDEVDERPASPPGSTAGSVFSGDSIVAINREIDHIKDLLNLTGPSNAPSGPSNTLSGPTSYARDVFRRSYRVNISHARIYQELDSLKEMLGNPPSRPVSPDSSTQKSFGDQKASAIHENAEKVKDLTTQLELSVAEREKALTETEELRQQHTDSLSSLQTANKKIQDLESRRLASSTSLAEAHEQIQKLEKSLSETKALHEESGRQITSLTTSADERARALDRAGSEISALKTREQEVSASLVKVSAERARLLNDHNETSKSLEDANRLIAQWQSHHQKSFDKVKVVEEDRDSYLKSLENQVASLTSQQSDDAVSLEKLKSEHQTLKQTHGAMKRSFDSMKSEQQAQKDARDAHFTAKDRELERALAELGAHKRQLNEVNERHSSILKQKEEQTEAMNERIAALITEQKEQFRQHEMQMRHLVSEHARLAKETEAQHMASLATKDEEHANNLKQRETTLQSIREDLDRQQKSAGEAHSNLIIERDRLLSEQDDRMKTLKAEMTQQLTDAEERHAAALAAQDEKHDTHVKEIQSDFTKQHKDLEDRHIATVASKEEELKSREQELNAQISQQQQDFEARLSVASEAHQSALRESEDQLRKLSKRDKYFDDVKRDYDRRLSAVGATLEKQQLGREREINDLTEKLDGKDKEMKRVKRDHETRLKAIKEEITTADMKHSQTIAEFEKRIMDLESTHGSTIESKANEYEAAKASLTDQYSQTVRALEQRLRDMDSSHNIASASKDQAHKADKASLADAHSRTIDELKRQLMDQDVSHASIVQSLQQNYEESKQKEQNKHSKAIDDLEQSLSGLVAAHSSKTQAMEAEYQDSRRAHDEEHKRIVQDFGNQQREQQDRHLSAVQKKEQEIAELNDSHSKSVQSLKNEQQETLELRDNEIKAAHASYESQCQKLKEDFEHQLRNKDEEYRNAVELHGEKARELQKEHEMQLTAKEKELDDRRTRAQNEISQADENHQQQLKAKDIELKEMLAQHEVKTRDLVTGHDAMIATKDDEIKALKEKHEVAVRDLESSHYTLITEKDKSTHSMQEQYMQRINELENSTQKTLAEQQDNSSAEKRDLEHRLEELHKLRRTEASEAQAHTESLRAKNQEDFEQLEVNHAAGVSQLQRQIEEAASKHMNEVKELKERLEEQAAKFENESQFLKASHDERINIMRTQHETLISTLSKDAETSKAAALANARSTYEKSLSDAQKGFEAQSASLKENHEQLLARAIQLEQEKASSNENSVRQMVADELDRKHRYALKEVEKTYAALVGEQERQLTSKLEQRHQEQFKQLEASMKSNNIEKERLAREIGYTDGANAHKSQLTNLQRDHSSAMNDKDDQIRHLETLTTSQESEMRALKEKNTLAQTALQTIRGDSDDEFTKKLHSLQQELDEAISQRSEMEQKLTSRSIELSASQKELGAMSKEKTGVEEQLVSLMNQVAGIRQGLEQKSKKHMDTEMENKALVTRIYSLRQDLREAIEKRTQAEKSRDAILAEPPSLLSGAVPNGTQASAKSLQDGIVQSKANLGKFSTNERLVEMEAENNRLKSMINNLQGQSQTAQLETAHIPVSSKGPTTIPRKFETYRPRSSHFESRLLAAQRELAQLGKVIAQNEELFALKIDEHMEGLRQARRSPTEGIPSPEAETSFESRLSAAKVELIEMGTIISSNEGIFASKILEHIRLLRLTEDSLTAEYKEKFSEMLLQKSKLEEDLAVKYTKELAMAKSTMSADNTGHVKRGLESDNVESTTSSGSKEQKLPVEAVTSVPYGLLDGNSTRNLAFRHMHGFQQLVDEYNARISRLIGDNETFSDHDAYTRARKYQESLPGTSSAARRIDFAVASGRSGTIRPIGITTVPQTSAARPVNSSSLRSTPRSSYHAATSSDLRRPPTPTRSSLRQLPQHPRTLSSDSIAAQSSIAPSGVSTRFSEMTRKSGESALGGVKSRSSLMLTSRGLVRSTNGPSKQKSSVTCNFW